MTRYVMTPERHAQLFGAPLQEPSEPGRSRRCKSCGGWHRLTAWPHNCMPPRVGPKQHLAAPQLAPKFEPFVAGTGFPPEPIMNPGHKPEYMKRPDLVPPDKGVGHRNAWVDDRESRDGIVSDIKRFHQTDTENLPPELRLQHHGDTAALSEAPEVEAKDVEIIK